MRPDGGGGSTGPFDHYTASPSAVESRGDLLIDDGGKLANVASEVYAEEYKAASATKGWLAGLMTARNSKAYRSAIDLKDASLLAGGCARKFGHGIYVYNAGIDTLNNEYWLRKGADFGVPLVDSSDPAVLKNPKQAADNHVAAVAAAERALMSDLTRRKQQLDDILDTDAQTAASMLDKGPSDAAFMSLVQAGDLPITVCSLLPGIDFSKLDMRVMLQHLQDYGELPPGVTPEQIMAALAQVNQVLHSDNGLSHYNDLQNLLGLLKGLAPGAIDFVVLGLSDTDLVALDKTVNQHGLAPHGFNGGLSHWEVIDFHSLFLANASAATLFRLGRSWPSIEPDLGGVDAVQNHEMAMPHWGDPPSGGLFKLDANGNPVVGAGDVDQGMVGDCWLQAKMAALAQQHPEWALQHVSQNANGTISVVMYDRDGTAHTVTTTNQLPVGDNGSPVYSGNSGTGANWSSYYEKALAIASQHGSDGEAGYGGIEGGWGADDAQLMTGHGADDADGGLFGWGGPSFDKVHAAVDAHRPVVVGTNGSSDIPDNLKDSFHAHHEYYVIGFTSDGCIKLGNPWSSGDPQLVLTEDQFNDYINDAAVLNP